MPIHGTFIGSQNQYRSLKLTMKKLSKACSQYDKVRVSHLCLYEKQTLRNLELWECASPWQISLIVKNLFKTFLIQKISIQALRPLNYYAFCKGL